MRLPARLCLAKNEGEQAQKEQAGVDKPPYCFIFLLEQLAAPTATTKTHFFLEMKVFLKGVEAHGTTV